MTRITLRQAAMLRRAYAPEGSKDRNIIIPPQRAKRRNKAPEQILQVQVCKMLSQLPSTLYFAVPNGMYLGGKSSGARAAYIARQKAAGLLNGVSDLVIIFRNSSGATTLVVPELKSEKGLLSESQKLFADRANALGCYTGVVRSLDDLTLLLKKAGHVSFQ